MQIMLSTLTLGTDALAAAPSSSSGGAAAVPKPSWTSDPDQTAFVYTAAFVVKAAIVKTFTGVSMEQSAFRSGKEPLTASLFIKFPQEFTLPNEKTFTIEAEQKPEVGFTFSSWVKNKPIVFDDSM